jgi:hypothetical protein
MNQPTQFVVHDFKCLDSALFCPSDYSALKFGSDIIAEKFGQEMAFKFYSEHRDLLIADRCVIVPSAFNVVEIAATILARHFMNGLNDLLTREGHRMVEWSTMHRTMSYIADYSFLAKDERQKLLEADKLYINRDFIADKVLLFVDDVTITGTHEDKIVRFMADLGLINPMIFCYYARYQGEAAEIEAKLNLAGITSIPDYLKLVAEPNHHLVVRAVRFLLDRPIADLKMALRHLPGDFIQKLYYACLAKEYDKIDGYRVGFELIRARRDASAMDRAVA